MLYISLLICLLLLLALEQAVAFIIPIYRTSSYYDTRKLQLHQTKYNYERRVFIQSIISAATIITIPQPSFAADALLMDKSTPSLQAFSGDSSKAREWFALAIKDIDNLLSNYDEISMTGGDNVRLYLGTQGTKSHMYGISKVLKSMKEDVDDIVEFTECLNEFEAYLYQAEGAAYQSMFVEHSSAKSTPESLLKTAKGDIVNMRKYMGELADQLGIKA